MEASGASSTSISNQVELIFKEGTKNLSSLNDSRTQPRVDDRETTTEQQHLASILQTHNPPSVSFKVNGEGYFSTKYKLSINKQGQLCLHRKLFLFFSVNVQIQDVRQGSRDFKVWLAVLSNQRLQAQTAAKAFMNDRSFTFLKQIDVQRRTEIKKHTFIGEFETPIDKSVALNSDEQARWGNSLNEYEFSVFCERMEQYPDWFYIDLKPKLIMEHPSHERSREFFKLNAYLLRFITNHKGRYHHRLMLTCKLLQRCSHLVDQTVRQNTQSTNTDTPEQTEKTSVFKQKFNLFFTSLPTQVRQDLIAGLWLLDKEQPNKTNEELAGTMSINWQPEEEITPIAITEQPEVATDASPQGEVKAKRNMLTKELIAQWGKDNNEDFCYFLDFYQEDPEMVRFFLNALLHTCKAVTEQTSIIQRLTFGLSETNVKLLSEITLNDKDTRSPKEFSKVVNSLTDENEIRQTMKVYISRYASPSTSSKMNKDLSALLVLLKPLQRNILLERIDAFEKNFNEIQHRAIRAIRLDTKTFQFEGSLRRRATLACRSTAEHCGVGEQEQRRIATLPEVHIKCELFTSWKGGISGFCQFINTLAISHGDVAGDDDEAFDWFIQAAITDWTINSGNINVMAERALKILIHLNDQHAVAYVNKIQNIMGESFCFHMVKQLFQVNKYEPPCPLYEDGKLVHIIVNKINCLIRNSDPEQQIKLIDAISGFVCDNSVITELLTGIRVPLGECGRPLGERKAPATNSTIRCSDLSNFCLLYDTSTTGACSHQRLKSVSKKYYEWIYELDTEITELDKKITELDKKIAKLADDEGVDQKVIEKQKLDKKRNSIRESFIHYLHFLPHELRAVALQAMFDEEQLMKDKLLEEQLKAGQFQAQKEAQMSQSTAAVPQVQIVVESPADIAPDPTAVDPDPTAIVPEPMAVADSEPASEQVLSSNSHMATSVSAPAADDSIQQDIEYLWDNIATEEEEPLDISESDLIIESYRRHFDILVFYEEFYEYYLTLDQFKKPSKEDIDKLVELFHKNIQPIKSHPLYADEFIEKFVNILRIYRQDPETLKLFVQQLLETNDSCCLKVLGYYLAKERGFPFKPSEIGLDIDELNNLLPKAYVNLNEHERRLTISGFRRPHRSTALRRGTMGTASQSTTLRRGTMGTASQSTTLSRNTTHGVSNDDETFVILNAENPSDVPLAPSTELPSSVQGKTVQAQLPPAQPLPRRNLTHSGQWFSEQWIRGNTSSIRRKRKAFTARSLNQARRLDPK